MAGVATASATTTDCSNADMVDGMHAANFVPSTLGYGSTTTIATGNLLEYLDKSQLISGVGLTAAPSGSEWFIYNITVHRPNKHAVVVATAISETSNHTDSYIGVMDEFEWKGWSKVWTSKNLNSAAFATATQGAKADSAMQPSRITVGASAPAGAQDGDIWIKS